jgi:hypothetical protein
MINLSKKTRRELRQLLIKAYARELDQHLRDLSMKFEDWKNKKIDCWDLNDHIHKFHDGVSRDLFNTYNARCVDDIYMISRALANNLLQKEEIPGEAIDIIKQCANDFFKACLHQNSQGTP